MNPNRLHGALLAAIIASGALVGCKEEDAPAPMSPVVAAAPAPMPSAAPMAATASVNRVDLGNAVGADLRVTVPLSTFAPMDTFYVAVSTGTSDPAASVAGKLGAKWTYSAADGTRIAVHAESRDLAFSGDGVTDFQVSKPDGWPAGTYRVEILLDGAVVQTREFEVK